MDELSLMLWAEGYRRKDWRSKATDLSVLARRLLTRMCPKVLHLIRMTPRKRLMKLGMLLPRLLLTQGLPLLLLLPAAMLAAAAGTAADKNADTDECGWQAESSHCC